MKPAPELIRRQRATQSTMDKFRGKAFDWRGGITCVHLARFHLRAMGHRVEKLPRLRSMLAARRALDERGWSDCAAMLGAQPGLLRIAPAQMMMGDLVAIGSEDGLGGIGVCAGPLRVFGWSDQAAELVVVGVGLDELEHCFRV